MARVSKEQPGFASFVKNDLGIWKFLQKQPTRQAWSPTAKPPSLPNRIELTSFWVFGFFCQSPKDTADSPPERPKKIEAQYLHHKVLFELKFLKNENSYFWSVLSK
jgi:hypothetical protein